MAGVEGERNLLQDLRSGWVVAAVDMCQNDLPAPVQKALQILSEAARYDGLPRADRTGDYSLATNSVAFHADEHRSQFPKLRIPADQCGWCPVE